MLTISIILGIAMILNINNTNGNYDILMASALLISIYSQNIILFWVILVLLVIIGINYLMK